MNAELQRLREAERWIASVRVGGVAFAVFQLLLFPGGYPDRYEAAAWLTTGLLAATAALFLWLSRRRLSERAARVVGLSALILDTSIVAAFVLIFSFEPGTPIRLLLIVPLAEAALRYGLVGGIVVPIMLSPIYALFELQRIDHFPGEKFDAANVTFPVGVLILAGLFIGWLVRRLARQTALAETRAGEAERLRDQLGRRVDLLEAANRCARALASSLDLEQAFSAFIRELRGLVPFDRAAIVLAEEGRAQVMATAGEGAEEVFQPGTSRPVSGSVLEQVLAGQTVYREDMSDRRHPEEEELLGLGLRCRLVAPLLLGARAIGMMSLSRRPPDSFSAEERELLSLLGRLVATGVQNIRAYEAERRTVEELRRLSALRADFVSLVSHELRSPMAAVIGSARTLQERWRQLSAEQRESFLALIADETSRLAALIVDVLDTSRIEAGTFSFVFREVDVAEIVQESVTHAALGQDEVRVRADVRGPLPRVRGDRERLRQVLANLIDNAVKFSSAGDEVEVAASADNGRVQVSVRDRGPGIPREQQKLIFEKFGRAKVGDKAKPGTGLGLFIARSIAEAHGGSLEVMSAPGQGATFRLELPTSP